MATVTALYDTYEDASRTVRDLEATGVAHADISIFSSHTDRSHEGKEYRDHTEHHAAGTGAAVGTIVGGAGGLLAGLGLLAIPGVGPVVAAGWLVATIVGAAAGAATGGVLGALTEAGISEDEAHVYAESLRRGGTIVVARVDDTRVAATRGIMTGNDAVDIETRRDLYRNEGWERFDMRAEPADRIQARSAHPADPI